MKKLLLLFTFCVSLFAYVDDATMTITNKGSNLPKIVVQNSSMIANSSLNQKFFKLMVGDLKVGATFEVSDEYFEAETAP